MIEPSQDNLVVLFKPEAPTSRPKETITRAKVQFREEQMIASIPFQPQQKPAIPGSTANLYSVRADRVSRILLVVTAIVLAGLIVIFLVRPGAKNSQMMGTKSTVSHVQATGDSGDFDIIETTSLESRMQSARSQKAADSSKQETADDSSDTDVSASEQQTLMEEKMSRYRAKKKEVTETLPTKVKEDTTASAWTEPAKFEGVGLPTRSYDSLVGREIAPPKLPISSRN